MADYYSDITENYKIFTRTQGYTAFFSKNPPKSEIPKQKAKSLALFYSLIFQWIFGFDHQAHKLSTEDFIIMMFFACTYHTRSCIELVPWEASLAINLLAVVKDKGN